MRAGIFSILFKNYKWSCCAAQRKSHVTINEAEKNHTLAAEEFLAFLYLLWSNKVATWELVCYNWKVIYTTHCDGVVCIWKSKI